VADGPWRKTTSDPTTLRREAAALRLLGSAVVRLVGVEGADLLLERVVPGTPVSELPDDEATAAVAGALRQLWVPVPAGCPLPDVAEECEVLFARDIVDALPAPLVEAAQRRLFDLLATAPEPVVLHGDLHHGNLLWSARRAQWVAIDPHGVVGDAGYDVGPLLINPWERRPQELVGRRLDLLSDALGMPRTRLAAWGVVRAVLAEAWTVQDTGRPDGRALEVAAALVHHLQP